MGSATASSCLTVKKTDKDVYFTDCVAEGRQGLETLAFHFSEKKSS
jgi:hypothetical protein